MNKIILMGRLTKDPEVRYTTENKAYARISLAVDRRFKKDGQPDADFFNCSAFGKTAEFVEKYLVKGSKIVISGTLQNNNYTDNNGVKHYSDSVIIEELDFAESKAKSTNTEPNYPKDADGFMNVPEGIDEELPFAQPR